MREPILVWRSLPYCSRCGTELPAGEKFCANCGASTTAPLPSAPPLQAKPSHTKRNLALIVILVILVGVVAAASSRAPSQNVTTATTVGELPNGGTVRIGQPFIVKGTDQVPVQVNFTSAWFAMRSGYEIATPPYKLFVLQFQMKNVGIRTTSVFSVLSKWDVLVDKGYIYESELNFYLTSGVQAEQVATNNIIFSILSTTTPLEVRYYDSCAGSTADCSPTFTVDLRGTTIPAREELTLWGQGTGTVFRSCFFYKGKLNFLNITNSGLVAVTVQRIYFGGQAVYENLTSIQPGETVTIGITAPSNLQAGGLQEYEVKVVTTLGNTFTTSCYYEEA